MNDEITKGADILGALIMGHAYKSWWVGSDLTIGSPPPRPAPERDDHAGGDLGRGRDDVDDREPRGGREGAGRAPARVHPRRLEALPRQLHLHPLGLDAAARLQNAFSGFNKPDFDTKDPWQFKNFLIKDGD
jgi:homospermidine synthase